VSSAVTEVTRWTEKRAFLAIADGTVRKSLLHELSFAGTIRKIAGWFRTVAEIRGDKRR
jgi:hypothetical protein